MIGKLTKGTGARGLINYLLSDRDHSGDERPRVEIIGGTFTGRTERQLAAEFGHFHQLRPGLGVHVTQTSLRVPEDERHLTDEEWRAIGDRWATEMGFDGYTIVSHGDHIHIAASRITLDGGVVSDSQDWSRSEAIIREIEKDFGLRRVEASHLLEPERAETHRQAPTMARIALAEKGLASPAEQLADLIDATLGRKVTAAEFVEALETAGVTVRPNIASTGRLNGFSYEMDGIVITAKALGRSFTLPNLQKRGLEYDQNRDLPALSAARDRAADRHLEGQADGPDGPAPGGAGEVSEAGRGAGRPVGGNPAAGGGDGNAYRGNEANAAPGREEVEGRSQCSSDGGSAVDGRGVESVGGPGIPTPAAGGGGGTSGTGDGGTARAAAEPVATGASSGRDGNGGGGRAGVEGGRPVGEIRPGKAAVDVKADIWKSAYGTTLPEPLRSQLRYIDRDRHAVYLNDGAVVRDHGSRIATSRSTPAAIAIMIAEAKAKGWQSVEFTGGDEFKRLAAEAAVRAGLDVSNPELADIVAAEKAKFAEAEPTPGPSVQKLRDIAALPPGGRTEAAVRQQLAAMGVDKFEVGVIPFSGAPEEMRAQRTRTWDAEQVVKSLGWLRRQNQAGYEIYVRPAPIDEQHCHPLVMLDDLDAATVERIKADGYEPAAVIESSPSNYQVWLRLGTEPIAKAEATEAVRQLARTYGADRGAADWRHYSRLSGFTNRKPSRLQPNGLPPFCRLREAIGTIATKGSEFLEWTRALMFEKAQQEERAAARARQLQRDQAQFRRPDGLRDAVSAFIEIRDRIGATKPDGSPDESRRDFGAAVRLLEHFHPDQVAAALRSAPGIERKRDREDYVRRTIEAAEREFERQQLTRAAQAVAFRPRPRPAPGREVRR